MFAQYSIARKMDSSNFSSAGSSSLFLCLGVGEFRVYSFVVVDVVVVVVVVV